MGIRTQHDLRLGSIGVKKGFTHHPFRLRVMMGWCDVWEAVSHPMYTCNMKSPTTIYSDKRVVKDNFET